MKKSFIISLLAASLITSCSVLPKYPYVQESSILDYTAYTSKGFFITESNSVSFDYKAIGSVSAKVESGYIITGVKSKAVPNDDIYKGDGRTTSKVKYGGFKMANQNDALKEICDRAMEEGGNGIINLNIEPIISTTQYGTGVTGYFITGMAIRKLD